MYEVKNKIYLGLAKTQKSALCAFLRALVKKSPNLSTEEIFNKFLYDEKYYLQINSSRFEFLKDLINEENFMSETKLFLGECKKYYDYKKAQAPIIQAQKNFEKKKRKFLQEVKMSKELPTKKQLYYYEKLCKHYCTEKKDTNNLSKLDLKNLIEDIINEHKAD